MCIIRGSLQIFLLRHLGFNRSLYNFACTSGRELQDALSKVNDETWVSNTKTYQALAQELQRANDQLMSRTKELDNAYRERDSAHAEARDRASLIQV